MAERKAWQHDQIGVADARRDRLQNCVLVPVAVVVDASEGKPDGRDPDNRTCPLILLSPRAGRVALRRESAASIPASGRGIGFRVAREYGEKLYLGATLSPGSHDCTEGEHAVVQMRRHDDDPFARRDVL